VTYLKIRLDLSRRVGETCSKSRASSAMLEYMRACIQASSKSHPVIFLTKRSVRRSNRARHKYDTRETTPLVRCVTCHSIINVDVILATGNNRDRNSVRSRFDRAILRAAAQPGLILRDVSSGVEIPQSSSPACNDIPVACKFLCCGLRASMWGTCEVRAHTDATRLLTWLQ